MPAPSDHHLESLRYPPPVPDHAPTVVTTLPLTPVQRGRLLEAGVGRVVTGEKGGFDPDDLAEAEIWLGPGIRPADLEAAPNLRWIQAVSAGVDNFLFPELVASDVILTRARGLHAQAVADHTLMLVLAFARRLPEFVRQQDRHIWRTDPNLRQLDGSRMLIVGTGAIGLEIGRRAAPFGVEVRGVRRLSAEHEPLPFPVAGPERLDDELRAADWVVLALPLTEQTRHIIGGSRLGAMNPGAVLVNIGRGALVDEAALVKALSSRTIAGACLDVFEEEPLPVDSPLWSMPNVIVTPHLAGDYADLPDRELDVFIENLGRYRAGEPPRNIVDKRAGY